jgi:hypothetical protein
MIRSPETSALNHLTPHNNPEDGEMLFNRGGRSVSASIALCCKKIPNKQTNKQTEQTQSAATYSCEVQLYQALGLTGTKSFCTQHNKFELG